MIQFNLCKLYHNDYKIKEMIFTSYFLGYNRINGGSEITTCPVKNLSIATFHEIIFKTHGRVFSHTGQQFRNSLLIFC